MRRSIFLTKSRQIDTAYSSSFMPIFDQLYPIPSAASFSKKLAKKPFVVFVAQCHCHLPNHAIIRHSLIDSLSSSHTKLFPTR